MSDTPRTDDAVIRDANTMELVQADFARDLERELAKAKRNLRKINKLSIGDTTEQAMLEIYRISEEAM